MTKPGHLSRKLSEQVIEAMRRDTTIWDRDVKGFCVRREINGDIKFYLRVRSGARVLWLEIGLHSAPWTVETARAEAASLLAHVRNRSHAADGVA